jgi:hypothetical protein
VRAKAEAPLFQLFVETLDSLHDARPLHSDVEIAEA